MSVRPPISPAAQTSGSFSPLCQRKAACPASAEGGAAPPEAQHCGLVPPGGHPTPPTIWGRRISPHLTFTRHTNKKRKPTTLTPLSPARGPLPGPPALSPLLDPLAAQFPFLPSTPRLCAPQFPLQLSSVPSAVSPVLKGPGIRLPHLFLGLPVRLPFCSCLPQTVRPPDSILFPHLLPLLPNSLSAPSLPSFHFSSSLSLSSIFPSRSLRLPFPFPSLRRPLIFRIYQFSSLISRPFHTLPQSPPLSGNPPAEVPASVSFPAPFSVRGSSSRVDVRREGEGGGGPKAPRLGPSGLRPPPCHAWGKAPAGPLATGEEWSGPAGARGSAGVGAPPRVRLPSALELALDLSSAAQLGVWISSCACWFQTFSALPGAPLHPHSGSAITKW